MSELPVKNSDSILKKIKNAIMNFIFVDYEEEQEEVNVQEKEIAREEFDAYNEDTIPIKTIDSQAEKNDFNENLKTEVSNETLREVERGKFLEKVEANPELLKELPLENFIN